MDQQADDLLLACLVNTNNTLNHHSYHKAIVTVVNIQCDNVTSSETNHTSDRASHKVD